MESLRSRSCPRKARRLTTGRAWLSRPRSLSPRRRQTTRALSTDGRIGHAVSSRFDVTGEALTEARIGVDFDGEVVPTERSIQRPMPNQRAPRLDTVRMRLTSIRIDDSDVRCLRAVILE